MVAAVLRPLAPLSALLFLASCGSSVPGSIAREPAVAPSLPGLGASRCGDAAARPWCNIALSPAERTALLLQAMSLPQKLGLMAGDDPLGVINGDPATGTVDGIPELGIAPLYMSDGPSGPREGMATAMPSPLALGASFNPDLAHTVGRTIAYEVRVKANDLVHAPTVDVMRTGLAGRTFETYGEDPLLASRLGVEWIRGAQSQGVIGNVKHYLMNNQEGQIGVPPITAVLGSRQTVNAVVDERTLREIYLPPFEAAVKEADVGSVMCSYNLVNGSPTCASQHLLQEVLRDDWGFDGFVLSDYFVAVKDTVLSANNGAEIEMPIAVFYQPLLLQLAVISGLVPEQTIDVRVGNILRTLFRFGFFDRPDFPDDSSLIDVAAHAEVAREVAEQGTVLLKNNGLLPLRVAMLRSIAIIGTPADTYHNVGGSAAVTPFRFISPLMAITERAGPGTTVNYDDGSDPARAAALAAGSDVALVFVADDATEGVDKTCLSIDCPAYPFLPVYPQPQRDLIEAVSAANPNTVVMLEVGGPILTPWRDSLAALLVTWYPGQDAGPALARVLFGDVDPGGRLPLSFMDAEGDTPTANNPLQYPGVAQQALYSEGVFIGYRWHDANNVAPAYPFGHGLSYSSYALSDLQLAVEAETVRVKLNLSNTGARAGWSVAQLYAGLPQPAPGVQQPPNALKAFRKLWLEPGETQPVEWVLSERAFSYWDEAAAGWRVAEGCYALRAGLHSRELPLSGAVTRSASGWVMGGSC